MEEAEETHRKIEETVIEILKGSNLEEVTEFKVRMAASNRLGIDLSATPDHRRFIREVLESYLISTLNPLDPPPDKDDVVVPHQGERMNEEKKREDATNNNKDRLICKLSKRRKVLIQCLEGKSLVSIREYYEKDGKELPSKTGISLTSGQWSEFRSSVPAVEEAISMMQSKLRSAIEGQQNEHPPDLVTAAATPDEFIPVKIDRFDGKNYHSWVLQMEFFLKQLKIAYVLTEPCPSVSLSPDLGSNPQRKAFRQKWINDDYLCRHNILNSLSDSLYHQYSTKTKSAKELWEELKLVYLCNEFGTKRAQVKKYIEFQMVEEKSILDQLQELNSIADSLVAGGIYLDEKFHVSAVMSKLPPSWKDFYVKLLPEEYLPFWALMDRVRVEEESRRQYNRGKSSDSTYSHPPRNPGLNIRDMRRQETHRPCLQWKRQETQADNRVFVCLSCGKKGHLAKNCRSKNYQGANGNCDKEYLSTRHLHR